MTPPVATGSPVAPPGVLHAFRLRLLKILLLGGISSIALVWLFEGTADRVSPIDRFAYPMLLVVFSLCSALLYIRPALLEVAEQLSFASFAVYIVAHTQPAALSDVSLYTNASLVQWFPLVYTAAFFFLDTRHAVIVSVVIYLCVLLPNLAAILLLGSDPWASDFDLLLVNVFFSHPVYIMTLSGIARLKAQLLLVKDHADQMSTAANMDYLTGVANRRAAAHALQQSLARAQQHGEALSVILMDLDYFKRINDLFGHDVGDQVLIEVTGTLRQHLRATDMLGRWGGEEFIIIVPALGAEGAAELAERVRGRVAAESYAHVGQVTLSLGVATSAPGDTPEALVKRADHALYQAKQSGRNRVERLAAPVA